MDSEFYARDGFYFSRTSEDGNVRVRVSVSSQAEAPTLRVLVLSESEWASVVASVSATGETGDTFQSARDFHAGRVE